SPRTPTHPRATAHWLACCLCWSEASPSRSHHHHGGKPPRHILMAMQLLLAVSTSSEASPPTRHHLGPPPSPRHLSGFSGRREVFLKTAALSVISVALTLGFPPLPATLADSSEPPPPPAPHAVTSPPPPPPPPRKPVLPGIASTKTWFQYIGDGFSIRVPPTFEDIMEPEDYNAGLSLYGDKAKPKTFAARFASPDRSEVLSVVIRPSNQLKITFLEAQDITDLGTLKEAAKIFVPEEGDERGLGLQSKREEEQDHSGPDEVPAAPLIFCCSGMGGEMGRGEETRMHKAHDRSLKREKGSAKLYSARTIRIKEDESLRSYYFYEFGIDDQHLAVVAAVNSGKAIIAGASASQSRWEEDGVKLRSAAISLSVG
ncbi:hypothetical protein Taro_021618, partial [Colocasia esculenta]|nr:hypothetical protein [Colocasia esculenta]